MSSVPLSGCSSSGPPGDPPYGYGGNPTAFGGDFSCHQAYLPPLGDMTFICLRATYGDRQDERWADHYAKARAAGLTVIAYGFGRDQNITAQTSALLDVAHEADAWCLDREADVGSPTSMNQKQGADYIKSIQLTGRKCGLYFGMYNYADLGQDWDWLAWPETSVPPRNAHLYQRRSGAARGEWTTRPLADLFGEIAVQPFNVAYDDPHLVNVPMGTHVYDLAGVYQRNTKEGKDQVAYARGTLAKGNTVYWVLALNIDGDHTLGIVKAADVTDKGKLGAGSGGGGGHSDTYVQGFADAKAKAVTAVQGI